MVDESFITFGRPAIGEEEIEEVVACLRSGWIGTGPRVAAFEADFASYKGVSANQASAVNSCTAALHISMIAAGLDEGAEVITSPLTFCATVNAIIHAGLTPVLADVDPITQCLDPAAVEAAITPRTQAILPVHFAGYPCNMGGIMKLAERHGLAVIEDCAHAIETEIQGKSAGTFGDFGCFSFYATKNLVTGEGGMIIGSDPQRVARTRTLALHGMSKDAWHRFGDKGYKHYSVVECGFKNNMMDLQAAMGLHQLKRLEENWARRQNIWDRYQRDLSSLAVTLPRDAPDGSRHGYHLFTILIDETVAGIDRDRFVQEMNELRIGTGVHYLAVGEHPFYQDRFGWRPEDCQNAKKIGRQTVSLPLSADLTTQELDRITGAVSKILN
jgi:dTDP-4-amino-4,6-dideoxygalactose transaminase